jgi:glycosyltransferase involved in cell wall biosynthesis/VanZ family protein
MKVLIVSEPGENGVFTYVESLCHYLIEQGVAVHLGYSDVRGSDRLRALVAHVESSGGQTANLQVGSGVGIADFRAFFRLWRLAVRVRPDVIHCHSSKAGVLGRSLALAGIRSGFAYHPHAYYGMRPARNRRDVFYDLIEGWFGKVGTTVLISAGERDYALRRLRIPIGRLAFISNGVDTKRFSPIASGEKAALRDAFGIPRDRVVLGALSRLSPQKDPLTLYRAFAIASSERPELHLFHVGAGELEPEVDRLIVELGLGHRVTRLRYLGDSTGFYQAVDGFILTSTYEGLSLAALEAMSSDLPMILSRAPGNIDLLDLSLSHVWSSAPGDAGEFARCIGFWHESHREGNPPNHRSIARDKFDSGDAQSHVLSHYRSLARAGVGPPCWSARLPALIWIGLIAFESTDWVSRSNTHRFLYPLFHYLTGVGTADFYYWNIVLRKTGHVLVYGALGAFLYRFARYEFGHRLKPWSIRCAAIAFFGTMLVAGLDEWHQTFIPSRTGTVADVLLDSSAGLAAQVLIFLVAKFGGRQDPDVNGWRPAPSRPRPIQPTQ